MEETNVDDTEPTEPSSVDPLTPAVTPAPKPMKDSPGLREWKAFQEQKAAEDRFEADRMKDVEKTIDLVAHSLPFKLIGYISFILINLLPIGAIVVGILYIQKEDCPADKIAIILIVTGIFGTVTSLAHLYSSWKEDQVKKADSNKAKAEGDNGAAEAAAAVSPPLHPHVKRLSLESGVAVVFKLVQLCIFIYACVIVFGLYSYVEYEKYEPNSTTVNQYYCHKVLYRYAFWSLASSFILVGVMIGLMCCFCSCGICYMCWATRRGQAQESA